MRCAMATGGGSGGGGGVHSMMARARSPPPTRPRELLRPRARHQIIGSVELDTDATHDIRYNNAATNSAITDLVSASGVEGGVNKDDDEYGW